MLLKIVRHRHIFVMFAFRRQIHSLLRKDQTTVKWHFILTDSSSAELLRQEDKNVTQLQNMLQKLSVSEREIFFFVIILLTTKICIVENDEILFSYIRTVLEVFILYSLTISDFVWLCDSRAAYIVRQTKFMSELTFSFVKVLFFLNSCSDKDCLRLVALFEIMSRRERCRVKIIRSIVELINAVSSDSSFMTYNHESHLHQLNVVAFLKDIRLTSHYWIEMTYCLATEQIVSDVSSRYTVECDS